MVPVVVVLPVETVEVTELPVSVPEENVADVSLAVDVRLVVVAVPVEAVDVLVAVVFSAQYPHDISHM